MSLQQVSTRTQRPVRVLQVLRGMHRGGIESWLMHILRHADRERFQIDFLVHVPGVHDDEIRALGSTIHQGASPKNPLAYGRAFKQIVRQNGPYDVVHSHIHHYSGYIMYLARQAGVPVRIAHSHLDTSSLDSTMKLQRRGYLALMHHLLRQHATLGLAASKLAAHALFGPQWEQDAERWRVLYCGIDLKPFLEPVDRHALRAELNIPADALVMGHIGRFFEQKNHDFLIDILAEVVQRAPCTRLLLVGDGPLREQIVQKVERLGLQEHVIFTGLRKDVPQLMLGAIDVFVLPSLFEGLPIVGLEAQAAGLPCVWSDTITEELDCVQPLVQRLSLSQPASEWAAAVLRAHQRPHALSRAAALDLMRNSSFNVERGLDMLEQTYAQG
jgi:glycosyltransferase involved in cell wall biosynthesis